MSLAYSRDEGLVVLHILNDFEQSVLRANSQDQSTNSAGTKNLEIGHRYINNLQWHYLV